VLQTTVPMSKVFGQLQSDLAHHPSSSSILNFRSVLLILLLCPGNLKIQTLHNGISSRVPNVSPRATRPNPIDRPGTLKLGEIFIVLENFNNRPWIQI
jgi:hypothetical protein